MLKLQNLYQILTERCYRNRQHLDLQAAYVVQATTILPPYPLQILQVNQCVQCLTVCIRFGNNYYTETLLALWLYWICDAFAKHFKMSKI